MKYRIYPTPEQEAYLPRISGCVRLVHNLALEQREMFCKRSLRALGVRRR
jgi:transposase